MIDTNIDLKSLVEAVSELESQLTNSVLLNDKKFTPAIGFNRLKNRKSLIKDSDIIIQNLLLKLENQRQIENQQSNKHPEKSKDNEVYFSERGNKVNNDSSSSKLLTEYNKNIDSSLTHIKESNDNESQSNHSQTERVEEEKENKAIDDIENNELKSNKKSTGEEKKIENSMNTNDRIQLIINEENNDNSNNCNIFAKKSNKDNSSKENIENNKYNQLLNENVNTEQIQSEIKPIIRQQKGYEEKRDQEIVSKPIINQDIHIQSNYDSIDQSKYNHNKKDKIEEQQTELDSKKEKVIQIEKNAIVISTNNVNPTEQISTNKQSNMNSNDTKLKTSIPFQGIDQSIEEKLTQSLLTTSPSLELTLHIKSKQGPFVNKAKRKMKNESIEIKKPQFQTISYNPTTNKTPTHSKQPKSQTKQILPTQSLQQQESSAAIYPTESINDKGLYKNAPISPIKSPKKNNYEIKKGFFDRQKSFLKRVDEKKKKLHNDKILQEAKELNIIGAKNNKKLTNEDIKHFNDQMNDWEHKRLEHIKELKNIALNKLKANEEEIECIIQKRRKLALHSANYTQQDISNACNRLYKEELVKRKEKNDYLQKVYQPTFKPMLHSLMINSSKKKNIKSKLFINISMNNCQCKDELNHKHKESNLKKRRNLSQEDVKIYYSQI